jgi:hypothetical protein
LRPSYRDLGRRDPRRGLEGRVRLVAFCECGCERADQHGGEDGQDPTGEDIGEGEFLDGEEDAVVEYCEEGCEAGIDPESVAESGDKPGSGIRDSVRGCVGNHCSKGEPEGCKEEAFVWVGEGACEGPGVRIIREKIVIMTQVKRSRLRIEMLVLRLISPSKRLETTGSTKATPPVDIVIAYHAKVKFFR